MKTKLLLLLFLTCFALTASAQTSLYVDSAVSASGTGASWSAAFKTLGEGLAVANAAATSTKYVIHVAKGTYYPTGPQSTFNRDTSFFIGRGGIQVLGGYPSGGGSRSAPSNPTILSGNVGSASSSFDNSYHIMVCAGISASSDTTVVDGFQFTAGNANSSGNKLYKGLGISREFGGALYNRNVFAPLVLRDCQFTNNATATAGGAIYNDSSALYCNTSLFSGNTAPGSASSGGAIYWNNKNLAGEINLCSFSANSTGGAGGAIYCFNTGSTALIYGCTFNANTAKTGGALELSRNNAATSSAKNRVDSCVFTGNTASQIGGAIRDLNTGGITTVIWGSSFTGNTAGQEGGAINLSNATFTYCCDYLGYCTFNGNTAGGDGGAVWYNCPGSYTGRMEYCSFTGNKSGGSGGGFFVSTASGNFTQGSVQNCVFTNDTAAGRGGGACNSGSLIYSGCRFTNNKATIGGGLYFTTTGYGIIRNDTIQGNLAVLGGGGLYLKNMTTSPSVNNCLFAGNRAGTFGGAVYDSAASPDYLNCTWSGNAAGTGAAGMYNNASSPDIMNCIAWDGAGSSIFNTAGGTPTVTYSTVEGGYSGTGNLSAWPSFVSPLGASAAPTTLGDYRLNFCSPAIDAGNASISYSSYSDLAGKNRVFPGTTVDQGAFEYQGGSALNVPATACIGSTTQLSHTISGGTWTSSNTSRATVSSTGLLTPLATGVDTITYTVNGSGCATVYTRVITIYNPPVVPAILGADSVCPNGYLSGTVSNTMGGGTWSSSDTTILKVSSTGRLTGGLPGVATITYSVVGAGGCVGTASKTVRVSTPLSLAPITSRKSMCILDTIQLSTTNTGGYWSVSNPSVAYIVQPNVLTAMAAGRLAVRYTVTSGINCPSTISDTVTVNPQPVVGPIIAPKEACVNEVSVTLSDTTAGGTWRVDDPSLASIDNAGVLKAYKDGNLGVTYIVTNANGCKDSVKTRLFTVELDTTVTQAGAQLTSNQASASGYQWIDCAGNVPVPGATNQTYTATTNGRYAVVVNLLRCRDTSACYSVVGLGIADAQHRLISIHPNPASEEVVIEARGGQIDGVILRDAAGRSLREFRGVGSRKKLDVSTYPAGLYFLEVRAGGAVQHERLMIAR